VAGRSALPFTTLRRNMDINDADHHRAMEEVSEHFDDLIAPM
jgi:hypothetical protein